MPQCANDEEAQRVCCVGGIVGELVSDVDFRSSLVNEVHELTAFVQTRLSEAGSMQILGGSQGLLEQVPSATLKHWLQVRPDCSQIHPRTPSLQLCMHVLDFPIIKGRRRRAWQHCDWVHQVAQA